MLKIVLLTQGRRRELPRRGCELPFFLSFSQKKIKNKKIKKIKKNKKSFSFATFERKYF
jgi:hypothetical protein